MRLDQVLSSEGITLNESAQHLAVVSGVMLRLASLMRTNQLLGGSECSTLADELSQALAAASAEMAQENR